MPHQHRHKEWRDRTDPQHYDEPDSIATVEALLAQEQHRWRESPEPEQPAAHRGGFSLPAEGATR